ncbi:MAG: PQQ-binding-like beta-propeller repeat protein [Treponemataceae bacterium]|nr:MAG: PQQ-binding-like beta-propeller repeat protein [Treponemataceae bacterium]
MSNSRFALWVFACALVPQYVFGSDSSSIESIALLPEKPDWRVAVTGNVQTKPVDLPYGAAFITEGKLITAYNNDSKLLWMQHFSDEPAGIFATDRTGALYIAIGKTKIAKINTDGRVLWTTDTKTDIAFPATLGLDGRIFVSGESSITCIGTKGVIRWQIDLSVEDASAKIAFPLVNLDDGSVLIFVESSKVAGGIIAKRISPYGGALTESILKQKILAVAETRSGAVILFASGELALFALTKTQSLHEVWRTKISANANIAHSKLFVNDGKLFFASFDGAEKGGGGKGGTFYALDSASGAIRTSAEIPAIDFGSLLFCGFSDLGPDYPAEFIAIDSKTAFAFSPSKNAMAWAVSLTAKKDWKYVCYAGDGMLVFTESNWVISGYRVRKPEKRMTAPTNFSPVARTKSEKNAYRNNFVLQGKALTVSPRPDLQFVQDVSQALKTGFFGDDERVWLKKIHEVLALRNYRVASALPESVQAPYHLSSSEMAALVPLMAELGSAEFLGEIALLLHTERDTRVLAAAIKAAGIIAYDPDGELLAGLNAVLLRGGDIGPRFYAILRESALSIIRYMGGNYAKTAGRVLRY